MAKKKGANATIAIIILLVMGLAGLGAANFGGTLNNVATVGDAEIDVNDYARAFQSQMRAYQDRFQQPITAQQARAVGLDQLALAQLVQRAVLENEAAKVGISVGDENVSREITSVSAFRGASGEFNRQAYEFALREQGLSTGEFEARVRRDVASGLLTQALQRGVETPDVFTDTLYNYARETRDVTWARLTADDLEEIAGTPTESDLQAYHQANPDAFTRPETKKINYAWLTPEMIAKDLEIDDEQLRTLYNDRIDQFVTPERRLVERLAFANDADATAAMTRLESGEISFDDLVAERGLLLEDLDLGDVSESELAGAGSAVFALEAPGVIGPLPSDFGPALFRMNGVLAAQETSFEEAKPELQEEAATERARRIIFDLAPQLEDMLAGGADPALLAERTDLRHDTIDWNTEVFDGIAAYASFRRSAATLSAESFPEVVELDDGGIAVLKVEDVMEPALRPLDEVREQVAAAWTRNENGKLLAQRADEIVQQIQNGRDMAAFQLDLHSNRDLNREGFVEGTPPSFHSGIFEMEANELRVIEADGDVWLVRLDTVNAAPEDTAEAQLVKLQFSLNVAEQLAAGIGAAYARALLAETPASINQQALNAVHTQIHQ